MPQGLNDKLDVLENQIKYFIATQKCSVENCCRFIRGRAVTTHEDGNVEQIEFEGTTCPNAAGRPSTAPESRDAGCDSTCGEEKRPQTSSAPKRKDSVPKGRCPCLKPPFDTAKCTCKSKDKDKDKDKKATSLGREEKEYVSEKSKKGKKASASERGSSERRGSAEKGGSRGAKEPKAKKEKAEKAGKEKKGGKGRKAEKDEKGEKAESAQETPGGQQVGDTISLGADKNLKKLEQLEAQLKTQEEKLRQMEIQLAEAQNAKQMALDSTKELKSKYDELRSSKGSEADAIKEEIKKLQAEKADLTKKVQKESERRMELEKVAKETVQKERKNMTEKVEKLELQAAKSAKKLKRHASMLTSAVKQKDDHIRRLSGTTEMLAESIRDKDAENRRLSDAQKETLQNFVNVQERNKVLAENNDSLIRSIKQFQDKLHGEKTVVQNMQKQISECKCDSQKMSDEILKLKSKLKDALQGANDFRRWQKLQAKLRESRERERLSTDEAALLAKKMQEMVDAQNAAGSGANDALAAMVKDMKKLQSKYDAVLKELQTTREEDELRIQTMKEEIERFKQEAERRQNILIKEKESLQADYDRLSAAAVEDQEVLRQLVAYTNLQDRVIKSYENCIADKERQIEAMHTDIENSKIHIGLLEGKIVKITDNIQAAQELAEKQMEEIEALKKQIEAEREKILEKEKIIAEQMSKIEDLNVTIAEQKQKISLAQQEAQLARDDAAKAEEAITAANLAIEKEREEMTMIIAEMTGESLGGSAEESAALMTAGVISKKAKKVEGLLDKIGDYCRCDSSVAPADGEEENPLAKAYEEKASLIQREAMLQVELVMKQKDQAVSAARFATERLLETASDFQNQVEIHRKVQLMLTMMLKEKECELKRREQRRSRSRRSCTPTQAHSSHCPCGSG